MSKMNQRRPPRGAVWAETSSGSVSAPDVWSEFTVWTQSSEKHEEQNATGEPPLPPPGRSGESSVKGVNSASYVKFLAFSEVGRDARTTRRRTDVSRCARHAAGVRAEFELIRSYGCRMLRNS